MRHPIYSRSQAVTMMWIVTPLALAGLTLAMLQSPGTAWLELGLGITVLLGSALLLGRLTIEVGEGRIAWRYGYLGWPRWQLALADVVAVETTTSSGWEGWGIRKTRSGMLYNASGMQAVRLTLKDGRSLRLGSDEPERLAGFIRSRMGAR